MGDGMGTNFWEVWERCRDGVERICGGQKVKS